MSDIHLILSPHIWGMLSLSASWISKKEVGTSLVKNPFFYFRPKLPNFQTICSRFRFANTWLVSSNGIIADMELFWNKFEILTSMWKFLEIIEDQYSFVYYLIEIFTNSFFIWNVEGALMPSSCLITQLLHNCWCAINLLVMRCPSSLTRSLVWRNNISELFR